jgi:hypothetical protein
MTTEEEVEAYNRRVYKGQMPAHNKAVLRDMIEKENRFWEADAVREDSNISPVEGI